VRAQCVRADRGPRRAPRVPALAIAALLVVPSAQPPRHAARHTAPQAVPQPAPQAVSQAAPVPAAVAHAPVQPSTRITPDTVRIGEPFLVVLHVRAPKGATITFPAGPDSGATVEALDPRTLATESDASSTEYSATYRLAAWDLGRQPVAFAPATVHGGGADGTVPFGDLTILVRATTPADAAHRIPRGARALFAMPRTWWPLWQIAVVALGSIVLLWLLVRWWRRRPRAQAPSADPFADATREFGTLDGIGLLDAGEPGRYMALAIDITRTYLVRRLAPESMAFSSAELIAAVAEDRRIPQARLRALLAEGDRVKFARHSLSTEEASAIGADARRLVEEVEQRVAAAEAAAAAAAATTVASAPGGRRDSASSTRGHAA
jgi:hypothetical protein